MKLNMLRGIQINEMKGWLDTLHDIDCSALLRLMLRYTLGIK